MSEYLNEDDLFKPADDYLNESDLGFEPQGRTALGTAKDIGVSAAKGVVGLGEAVVGLGNLASGGLVGKGLDKIGYDTQATRQFLDKGYSPQQQEANRKVDEAKGFFGKAGAMLQNPSTIGHALVETAPLMAGGGAIGGAGVRLASRFAPKAMAGLSRPTVGAIAGGAGEGVISTGSMAEQIRQQTPDKELTGKGVAASVGAGIGTGIFGAVGGRLAQKLGLADVDTMLATGSLSDAVRNGGVKEVARRIVGGGITEGVFEELPQSIQETIWENAALDEPLLEGVPEAAAESIIVGGAMGGAVNLLPRRRSDIDTSVNPETGQATKTASDLKTGVDAIQEEPPLPDEPPVLDDESMGEPPGQGVGEVPEFTETQSSQRPNDQELLNIIRNPKKTTRPTDEQRPLFDDLVRRGLARNDGGTYSITPKGIANLAPTEGLSERENQTVLLLENKGKPTRLMDVPMNAEQRDALAGLIDKGLVKQNKNGTYELLDTELGKESAERDLMYQFADTAQDVQDQADVRTRANQFEQMRSDTEWQQQEQAAREYTQGRNEAGGDEYSDVVSDLKAKGFDGTIDRLTRGVITLEDAKDELAGGAPKGANAPASDNPADFAAELKAQGVGRKESWSRWIQRTGLSPGMDAKDWYEIYESVSPAVGPATTDQVGDQVGTNIQGNSDQVAPDMDTMVAEAARWRGATNQVAQSLPEGDKRAALRLSRTTTKGDLDAYLMKRFGIDSATARSVSNELTARGVPGDMSASVADFADEPWAVATQPLETNPVVSQNVPDGERQEKPSVGTDAATGSAEAGTVKQQSSKKAEPEQPVTEKQAADTASQSSKEPPTLPVDQRTQDSKPGGVATTGQRPQPSDLPSVGTETESSSEAAPAKAEGATEQRGESATFKVGKQTYRYTGKDSTVMGKNVGQYEFLYKGEWKPVKSAQKRIEADGVRNSNPAALPLRDKGDTVSEGGVTYEILDSNQPTENGTVRGDGRQVQDVNATRDRISALRESQGASENESLDSKGQRAVTDTTTLGALLQTAKRDRGITGKLAQLMADFIPATKLDIPVIIDPKTKSFSYNPQKNIITVRDPEQYSTSLHEIVHAVTVRELRSGSDQAKAALRKIKHLMRVSEKELIKQNLISPELAKLVREAKTSQNFKAMYPDAATNQYAYAMLNEYEFLAQAFSSKEFQSILKQVKVNQGGTLVRAWDAFVDAVMKALGINATHKDAFGEAVAIVAELSQMGTGKATGTMEAVTEFSQPDMELSKAMQRIQNLPAFREWFGGSVVTVDGKPGSDPLVVYHGTPTGGFSVFSGKGKRDTGWLGGGFYFTNDKGVAGRFTGERKSDGEKGRKQVYEVFLSVRNPLVLASSSSEDVVDMVNESRLSNGKDQSFSIEDLREYVRDGFRGAKYENWEDLSNDEKEIILKDLGDPSKMAETAGYDGIISGDMEGAIVVFSPTQIKSIFNPGKWSPTNPDIMEAPEEAAQPPAQSRGGTIKETLSDIFDTSYMKKRLSDIKFIEKIFSSPDWTFRKSPAAWRLLNAQYDRMEAKFMLEKDLIGNFVEVFKEAEKKFKADYATAKKYLLEKDRNGKTYRTKRFAGFKVYDPDGKFIGDAETKTAAFALAEEAWKIHKKANPKADRLKYDYKNEEGVWFSVIDENGKTVKEFTDEQEAVLDMMDREGRKMKKDGYSDKAVELVRAYREMTNRAFDRMVADLRKVQQDTKDAGLDEPTVSVVDETKRWGLYEGNKLIASFKTESDAKQAGGRKHTLKRHNDADIRKELSLSEAISQISDLRGSYFARQRPRGAVIVRAEKGTDKVLLKTDMMMVGEKYIDFESGAEIKRPEGGKAMFNWLVGNVPGTVANKMRSLRAQGYEISIEKDTSMPESVFDVAKLSASVASILDDAQQKARGGADKAAVAEISKLITANVADIFKARGYLSSRLKRQDDYWTGFEEDPLLSGTQYARGLAAGIAKKEAATKMLNIITGRDVPYQEWKIDNPDGTADEYQEFVEKRKIDPKENPEIYREAMSFTRDMLRNQEQIDRTLGTLQGLAVIKFLGFRISSAAVNATNMVQAVPATISAQAGVSLTRALQGVTNAATQYGKLISGKGNINAEDRAIFQEIIDRGWDQAQYNKEAADILMSRFGRAFDNFSEWSMKMFGAVEKANRSATIFAAYKELKRNRNIDRNTPNDTTIENDLMIKARAISNDAHGVYGSATRPSWTRGAWNPLKLPFTFVKFSQNYIMNMTKMGLDGHHKQAAYMLLSPAVLAGGAATMATPAIVALASALGIGGDDPEEEFYQWVEDNFGSDRFARHGIAGLAGVNFKGSLQINNPMPTRMTELFGAPQAIFMDMAKGVDHLRKGELAKGAEAMLPTAFGSGIKAVREAREGISTGNYSPVYYGDEAIKADGFDATLRFLSFNPARISGIREKQWSETKVERKYTERRTDIYSKVKRYYLYQSGDIAEIMKEVSRYNEMVLASGRVGIPFITPTSIKSNILRAARPSKKEMARS